MDYKVVPGESVVTQYRLLDI